MSRITGLIALIILMLAVHLAPFDIGSGSYPLSLSFGFLLLAAYVLGKVANFFKLPGITGYLIAGFLFGPSLLNFIDAGAIDSLGVINSFALTIIALTAGGEVDLKSVWQQRKSYGWILGGLCLVCFAGVMAAMTLFLRYGGGEVFPTEMNTVLVVAALMAVIAMASSPSATVAVIVESGARGKLSSLVLGITILKDFIVVVAFALAVAAGSASLGHGTGGPAGLAGQIAWEIFGSLGMGLLIAGVIITYMKYVDREIPLFIIAMGFVSYEMSHLLHLHALLVCMAAGIFVRNLGNKAEKLIEEIEKASLPVYVVFFAIAGAGLHLEFLLKNIGLIGVLAIVRVGAIVLGTTLGASLAGEDKKIRNHFWMGMLSQAGVALGMVVVVSQTFPEWGPRFKDIMIGSIALFELAGPVIFKYSLVRTGEVASP